MEGHERILLPNSGRFFSLLKMQKCSLSTWRRTKGVKMSENMLIFLYYIGLPTFLCIFTAAWLSHGSQSQHNCFDRSFDSSSPLLRFTCFILVSCKSQIRPFFGEVVDEEETIAWIMSWPIMLPASDASRCFSLAVQAEPNEMVRYGVIDHLCQTKAGIHRGLSSIHYVNH